MVAEVASELSPGTALDLGCGEGGDVLWLAERGWRATGMDAAAPALSRARDEALARGLDEQVEFQLVDLAGWEPPARWDLVTCHYLHEVAALRERALSAAVRAVAPGGTLVVVGHHPDESPELAGPPAPLRFRPEELASALTLGEGWTVSASSRPREAWRDGTTVQRLDAVVIAVAPLR